MISVSEVSHYKNQLPRVSTLIEKAESHANE